MADILTNNANAKNMKEGIRKQCWPDLSSCRQGSCECGIETWDL